MNYAFFISPHGFGHASRSLALMEALLAEDDQARFHLFTTVPPPFFEAAIGGKFVYHPLACDVGFVQPDPFSIDFPATRKALADMMPLRPELGEAVCREMAGCRFAICDISPLGIHAARMAGIPSVLVENFTWDDIYAYFSPRQPFLEPWADLLRQTFSEADYHIQIEPVCRPEKQADLQVGPVSRLPELARSAVRRLLSVGEEQRMVLVSLGGFPYRMPALEAAAALFPETVFIAPSGHEQPGRQGNLVRLPQQNGVSHAAIVHAADALVCKAGYSTLAEGYCAGLPVAAIVRDDYPESPTLEEFVARKMGGICLNSGSLAGGGWLNVLPELFARPRQAVRPSAAGEVARFLLGKCL